MMTDEISIGDRSSPIIVTRIVKACAVKVSGGMDLRCVPVNGMWFLR